jgi:hypothetical protein
MKSTLVGMLVVMGCGALLAACASGEPAVPAPVVMGAASGTDAASPGNPPSYMPAPRSPAPRRAATELSPKIHSHATEHAAANGMNRHQAVAAKERRRMVSKPVAHRSPKQRHPKLARNKHGQTPRPAHAEAIPLDAPATTSSPGASNESAAVAGKASSWASPRPSGQSDND